MKTITTLLIISVAALLAFGAVILYSAVGTSREEIFMNQLKWYPLAVIAGLVCGALNYQWLRRWVVPACLVSLAALVLSLVPGIGVESGGAKRWIQVGGMTFQPSEMAKLGMLLALGVYIEANARKMGKFKTGILLPGLMVVCFLSLLLLEEDFGSTLLFFSVAACLLLIAGVNVAFFLVPGLVVVGAIAVVMYNNANRMERVDAWLHPELHAEGRAYQQIQSTGALIRGGLQGRGLGNGALKGRLPQSYSDFIFAVVGEELGFLATMTILLLFCLLAFSGFYIAWHARDTFGMILASGVTLFITIQAIVHMGVGTFLLPNKGFPLPFFSAGGTNLMFNLVSVGLLFSVARQGWQKQPKSNPFRTQEDLPLGECVL